MKKRIKLIAVDLDGTLLTDDKSILSYTKETLKKAVKQGVHILIATGRPYLGIPEELRTFPGFRYAMTSNGARVIDMKDDSTVMEKLLPREKALKALEIGAKYDTLQEIYYDGQGYAEKSKMEQVEKYHRNPFMWEYFLTTRKPVDNVFEMAESRNQDMDKMQILFADLEERKLAWPEFEKLGKMTLVDSIGYNIEINAEGVEKGTVLLELGEQLGIKREEIMAFGDGDNDSGMVEKAGFGVAMANAMDSVKAVADYITESNNDEGVAKAIEKFVLRGGERC